jgi:predicted P-loop ATPase
LGAQGRGKSRLVRWLCPLPQLFNEGPISPDNKDDQIKLLETWLWEVAELDSTTKRAERSALKHFITMRNVGVRVPYGRYAINKTAVASMIGTINEDGTGFLNDPTGDRRFVVIHLDDIDWNYTQIDIGQLWAELYAAYLSGETWELIPHEKEIQSEINKRHTISTPVEEMIMQYFVIDKTETGRFMATMDILDKLEAMGLKGDQYKNKMELGAVLTKAGLTRVQKRVGKSKVRGYEGIWFEKANIPEVHI